MMVLRSLDELAMFARASGATLDDDTLRQAAAAMDVWWDEMLALRSIDLGYCAPVPALEPRTAPPIATRRAPQLRESSLVPHATVAPTNLADCTASELLALYAAGAATPLDTVEACLARIERVDPLINSVITLVADRARNAAQESTRRWSSGTARALDGVPFGLKDNIETAGIRTTGGSNVRAHLIPSESAVVVDRLEAAGAILLAKLATTEFACGGAINPWYGAVRNPWDIERFAGSSSSGPGGATGARLVPFSIGTDTLGSIRVPAICCGVVGLKPTYGRVPRHGVMPLSWTMDHVGPLARSVEDCARVLDVIGGPDARDEASMYDAMPNMLEALGPSLSGVRIGALRSFYEPLSDDAVVRSMNSALEVLRDAGAEVVDVAVPGIEHSFAAGWMALLCEGACLHEELWNDPSRYDPGLVFRLLVGKLAPATDYVRALRMRTYIQQRFCETLDHVDLIALPGMVDVAPRYDDLNFNVNGTRWPLQKQHARFTGPGNVTGLPAICVPSGLGRDDMPVALQLYGARNRDDLVLRAAHAFQLRTDHHRVMPTGIAALL